MPDDSFSKRHGYRQKKPITVREDAPRDVRDAVLMIASEVGQLTPGNLRWTICSVLSKAPDPSNFSGSNVWDEAQVLIHHCEWYRVYDIAEAFYASVAENWQNGRSEVTPDRFEARVNEFFEENGIGYQMVEGKIQFRGGEEFERTVGQAKEALAQQGHKTAEGEIHEALLDLSRRPQPDRTGAVQHAVAALECLAREVCEDQKPTFGDLMKRYKAKLDIPSPLDSAVEKAWGYASEFGRHLREGREPTAAEAELVVSLSAAIATFLCSRSSE